MTCLIWPGSPSKGSCLTQTSIKYHTSPARGLCPSPYSRSRCPYNSISCVRDCCFFATMDVSRHPSNDTVLTPNLMSCTITAKNNIPLSDLPPFVVPSSLHLTLHCAAVPPTLRKMPMWLARILMVTVRHFLLCSTATAAAKCHHFSHRTL